MSNPKKPRKLPKAELIKRALHQRVQQERSQPRAAAREKHLRELMGLGSRVFSDGTSIRDEPMNAPLAHPLDVAAIGLPAEIASAEAVYAKRCEARALLYTAGKISLHDAVDELQAYAEDSRLVDHIGQDEAQHIMGAAFAAVDLLPEAQDEDCEREIFLRTAELVQQWEMADPRDRWRHTGEQPPRAVGNPATVQPYRTPQATIDAFWYVAGLDDPDYLKRWLEQHPRDAETLCKLWEGKNAIQA